MRLKSIGLSGVLAFREPALVDLEAIGPGLVAFVGPNGAGKTSLLEAAAAALYKSFPSRPASLYEYSEGRDAWIEACFEEDGVPLRVRVQIDAVARKIESYLFEEGRSLTTGRAAEFDAEVAKRFGSQELLLASVFAAQTKAGNFLVMPRVARKVLFAELLGLERLEALHEKAKTARSFSGGALTTARDGLCRAREERDLLGDPDAELAAAHEAEKASQARLEAARTRETVAIGMVERVKAAAAELKALADAEAAAEQAVADAQEALRRAEAAYGQADVEASRRRKALEALDPDAMAERARERQSAALAALRTRREAIEKRLAEEQQLRVDVKRIPELEAERATLAAAEKVAAEAQALIPVAQAKLRAARQRLTDAEVQVERDQARQKEQTALLDQVPCTAAPSWRGNAERVDLAGNCPLLAAANQAKGQVFAVPVALHADVDEAGGEVRRAQATADQAQLQLDPLRLAEVDQALNRARLAQHQLERMDEVRQQLQDLEAEDARYEATFHADLKEAEACRARRRQEETAIAADLLAARQRADQLLEEARTRGLDAQARLAAAIDRLYEARHGAPGMELAEGELSAAREERYAAERDVREADHAAAGAAAKVGRLRGLEGVIATGSATVAELEADSGDWGLLEQALGRDGIQALQIDAAGPEVARLANELLESCYGPRFRIAFETLREKKSARGEYTEVFDIHVYDGAKVRQVEALSGGEKVVVGEAIGLALSIFNARRSGLKWRTLFRDETSGALDPTNAQAYVDMLRRALALGGFHQVLFVSHQPEVWERADARVLVHGGTVSVEGSRQREEVLA